MNPKIFVFIAVLILMAILAGIILVGPTLQVGSQNENSETSNITLVKPLQVELEKVVARSQLTDEEGE